MTLQSAPLSPPLSFSGTARWFGRNLLEALIWAFAGAAVLVLVLAINAHPQATFLIVLSSLVVAGGLAAILSTRLSEHVVPMSLKIFRLKITVVVDPPGAPQQDRR